MSDKKYLIMFDSRDNDSVFTAGLVRYYYTKNNIDRNRIILSDIIDPSTEIDLTDKASIVSHCEAAVVCGCSIPSNAIRNLYGVLGNDFIEFQSDDIRIQEVKSVYTTILGSYDPSRGTILNAFKFLYDQMDIQYKNDNIDDTTIPVEFAYVSSCAIHDASKWNILLDNAIKYDYGVNVMFPEAIEKVAYVESIMSGSPIANLNAVIEAGESVADFVNGDVISEMQDYGDDGWTVAAGRTAIMTFTPHRLSDEIISQFSDFETIITLNRLKSSNWQFCVYKVLYDTSGIDRTNMSIEDKAKLAANEFNIGEYVKNNYGGVGNRDFGCAEIKEREFTSILRACRI